VLHSGGFFQRRKWKREKVKAKAGGDQATTEYEGKLKTHVPRIEEVTRKAT